MQYDWCATDGCDDVLIILKRKSKRLMVENQFSCKFQEKSVFCRFAKNLGVLISFYKTNQQLDQFSLTQWNDILS